MRVLLTHNPEDLEAYYQPSLAELETLVDVIRNPRNRDLATDELIDAARECDIIVAHRSTPGEHILFERCPKLLAMLRTAIDVSTIDVDAASDNGVLVANAEKSFIASTAELALGLLLDAARHISASTVDYRSGRAPQQRLGWQLRGRTAGIIGYGSIGSYLAELLAAIGMLVVVHDPLVGVPPPSEQVDMTELLRRSDAVFPLTPGGDEYRHLIGELELSVMRDGAILVNVSRGEVLDEAAIASALESGRLGALAMDVGQAPDQRPSPRLASHERVVATPHLGGLTPANAYAQSASSVEQVRAILNGVMPPRSLNPESASRLRAYWQA
ncbi:MAG: hydroxyacid dehydrogenase [Acidimicrobiia bacterium]|nr:hydroxyacid dehydrogenase [Acidimicrobiia bacterium]